MVVQFDPLENFHTVHQNDLMLLGDSTQVGFCLSTLLPYQEHEPMTCEDKL